MSFKLTCCFLSARLRGPPSLRPFLCDPRSYSTATAAAAAAAKSAARPSVLMASSTDIAFNLATEAFLKDAFSGFPKQGREAPSEGPGGPPSSRRLLAPEKQGSLLFLWRNDKTIVIGRHQNAWKECDVAQMQKEDVKLARRYSGGGAVYQDLGNTCFTIFSSDLTKEECTQIIVNALKEEFGIDAVQSGRNDLVTKDGRKFSGSAYVKSPRGVLHHGTLMREVDCGALGRLLTPNAAKLRSKGVSSVESRVINLKDICPFITHEALCDALHRSFLRQLKVDNAGAVPVQKAEGFMIGGIPLAAHPGFHEYLEEVGLVVVDGTIKECRVFSDALMVELIQAFQDTLTGATYTAAVMHSKLAALRPHFPGNAEKIDEFAEWLAEASQS